MEEMLPLVTVFSEVTCKNAPKKQDHWSFPECEVIPSHGSKLVEINAQGYLTYRTQIPLMSPLPSGSVQEQQLLLLFQAQHALEPLTAQGSSHTSSLFLAELS